MRWLFSKVMVEAYANSHSLPELVAEYSEATCSARESTPDVAPQELRKEEQMGGPVNCNDSELSIYLQALAEGYLPTFYSDTSQSAQSKSISIASRSYRQGRQTVHFHGFPSLEISRNSTGIRGEELLMSFVAGSRARTSALPEAGPDWTAKGQGYGEKWRGLLGRFDPDSCSLKTAQLSLLADLTESSPTLPRFGLMLDGELYPQPMLEPFTAEREYGYWPTPTCDSATDRSSRYAQGGMPLTMAVKMWPTPQASDNRDRGNASTPAIKRRMENGKQVMLSMCVSSENGRLNPDWVELLMGWPLGMTSLEPIKKEEINGWKVGFTFQCLQDMRKNIQQKTIQREAGGCNDLYESGALQQNVREQQRNNKASIAFVESEEAQKGEMRGMWIHEESGSSSLRPGSNEQRSEQPSDALQTMPRLLALYRQSPWEADSWEDGVPRVATGVANRMDRLKAIGNGQVPLCAATAWRLLANILNQEWQRQHSPCSQKSNRESA